MLTRLNHEMLMFDGGMGSQLQARGLKAGQIPEELNIDNPEMIISIHESYLKAGADFITTNTFGCNRLKMAEAKYSVSEMIKAAIANAKEARRRAGRENDAYIALDIGPIGQLLKPIGTLSFDEAYDIIAEQVSYVKDEVDLVLFETMSDLYEIKAGILAVKEMCDLPVFTSMTFEKSGRTLTGVDPQTFVNVVEGLGVTALGANCSMGPTELMPIVKELLSYAHVPVLLQPNAGLPIYENGNTVYKVTPDMFAEAMLPLVDAGVAVMGGCCGTTPDHIRAVKNVIPANVVGVKNDYITSVSSQNKTVALDGRVVVCGERLNPTGKKKMQAAIREGRYDELVAEAIRQEEAGADVLDVNVGLPGIDEPAVMKKVIMLLQEVINLPLQIDSSNPEAIEVACRYYNGKPLINSVNAKDSVLDAVLPVVKKYGGVVIGLTLEEGIPLLAEERVGYAKKIIDRAVSYGIRKEDVVIDCLTLTASAQQKEVAETLKAVGMIHDMGHHAVLGVSNVSFGLPNRPLLNRTFLALAMQKGLDLPIINPLDEQLMSTIDAYNVLYYFDKDSVKYIEKHSNDVVAKSPSGAAQTGAVNSDGAQSVAPQSGEKKDLGFMIRRGLKDEVFDETKKELETKAGLDLINDTIIPALNQVGRDYEKGSIFLPQLIQAAETAKVAFEAVQETFTASDKKKGPIIICTVEGDVHDIGKNIVKVVMESYGYEMIDLGKDVKIDEVVKGYKDYKPKAIGLSALMTTTVTNMKMTIEALREAEVTCPIWVGGAVLTEDIAKSIDADYYTEDAMATVRLMESLNI